ncbi:MAG: AbrB/MazE/SpoVT family DNA-binding domain-containing protein [Terriglobales bacterium]|jgi:antitoxin MazE
MKTEMVRIGNSRGIRLPTPIIEQCGLGEIVELRVENDRLIISPGRRPRRGWDEAFRVANGQNPRPVAKSATRTGHPSSSRGTYQASDDELLLEGTGPNEFDHKEWRW